VPDRRVEQLPLIDVFKEVDQVCRAVMDHIERGFLPKVNDLERLVRPNSEAANQPDVTDLRIRNYAGTVLTSDEFTHEQCCKLDSYIESIDQEVTRELKEQ